jgi:hypothetical protein
VSASTSRTSPTRGGGLEGEVDGDGGAAGCPLGAPDGQQDVREVVVGQWRGVGRRRRVGGRFGAEGSAGQVDEAGRRVGVGADVVEAELAEATFAARNRREQGCPNVSRTQRRSPT